ncbi:MAG: hypothetical protein HOP32_06955 [Nitrospira sp.]|nr:hypothetical protein [Nitrospira sp.]
MATAQTIMKAEDKKSKPAREHIVLIETKPKDEWFIRARTSRGREVWYLRFQVTGQHPQLFGPFKSKHQCLLFLDDALNALSDFSDQLRDECEKRMLREKCQKIWPPIVEYPLLAKVGPALTKGR